MKTKPSSARHLLVVLAMACAGFGSAWAAPGAGGPGVAGAPAPDRPRLLVLMDIGGDPDDHQSMVRLLVHANEFAIEGLVASASGTPGELKEKVTKPELIRPPAISSATRGTTSRSTVTAARSGPVM